MQKRFFWIGLLTVAALASGLPAAARHRGSPELRAERPAVRQCGNADLALKYIDQDAAMGGVRSNYYAFTNVSTTPCALQGYPKVVLINQAGQPLKGRKVTNWLPDDPHPAVNLAPGKMAKFQLNFNQGGAGHMGPPCSVAPRLRIMAPGTTKVFARKDPIDLCQPVEVSAVMADDATAQ